MVTKTVLAGLAVLAIAGLGSGIAYAQSSGPSPSSSNPAALDGAAAPDGAAVPGKPGGRHRPFLGRVEHGEFTARTKTGNQVIDVQRGVVTTVDAQSITVRSADGFSATYAIDPQAKVRKNRNSATISQVAAGDRVIVFAVKDGATVTVKRIGDAGPGK